MSPQADTQVAPISSTHPQLTRRETQTMSDFFETTPNLDASTMKLMTKYDENGDGRYSKSEVLTIVNDLRAEFHSNEQLRMNNLLLKRILMGAVVFFMLLVASMFGLSFAVASLTKETSVNDKGQLFNADGSVEIATNARADLFVAETIEDNVSCLTMDAVEAIKDAVLEGHNVVLQKNQDEYGQYFELEQLIASGATYDEEFGQVCFILPENGSRYCIFPAEEDSKCNTSEGLRRLQLSDNEKFADDINPDYDDIRDLLFVNKEYVYESCGCCNDPTCEPDGVCNRRCYCCPTDM